ncbi:hypothetical protein B5M44_19695 [Shinella sumterensis]|nr:hypothetical protein B5M44_19695 [Shinella sumterensis]
MAHPRRTGFEHPDARLADRRREGVAGRLRHLAALVGAGLLARQDSPNGKGYGRIV